MGLLYLGGCPPHPHHSSECRLPTSSQVQIKKQARRGEVIAQGDTAECETRALTTALPGSPHFFCLHSPSSNGPPPASSPSKCASLNPLAYHPQTSQAPSSAQQMMPPSSHLSSPEALSHDCSSHPSLPSARYPSPAKSSSSVQPGFPSPSPSISTTSCWAKPPTCPSRTSAVAPPWPPSFSRPPQCPSALLSPA